MLTVVTKDVLQDFVLQQDVRDDVTKTSGRGQNEAIAGVPSSLVSINDQPKV